MRRNRKIGDHCGMAKFRQLHFYRFFMVHSDCAVVLGKKHPGTTAEYRLRPRLFVNVILAQLFFYDQTGEGEYNRVQFRDVRFLNFLFHRLQQGMIP